MIEVKCHCYQKGIERCPYLDSVIDGREALNDSEYFGNLAVGMPSKGEMRGVIEWKLGHF